MITRSQTPTRWQVGTVLVIGLLSVSAAAIFIRLAFQASGKSSIGFSLVIAASRLWIAAVIFAPAWRAVSRTPQRGWLFSIAAGVFLALHFGCWITSLAYTSIAASTALVTTNPIWMALISWLWFHDPPNRRMVLGIAIALLGSLIVGFSEGAPLVAGQNPPLGNLLALLGSWAVTLYFLLGREAQNRGLPISNHAAITYTTAALVMLPLPWLFGTSYGGYSTAVYAYLLLIGLFPQAIGHTSLNWTVRWISPTLVTLTILAEPVGSSILGFLVFRENPGIWVWLGAGIILLGVAIAALNSSKSDVPQKQSR